MNEPRLTEKAFQRQVDELALLTGWRRYHTWLSIRSTRGFPDLVLVRPPRVIFAELKTDHGKIGEHQQPWLDSLSECPGVEVYLWRPKDWCNIVETLTKRKEQP